VSTRSLIEVNHDYLSRIEDDPRGFAAYVVNLVTHQRDVRATAFGARMKYQRHHTEQCPVEAFDSEGQGNG